MSNHHQPGNTNQFQAMDPNTMMQMANNPMYNQNLYNNQSYPNQQPHMDGMYYTGGIPNQQISGFQPQSQPQPQPPAKKRATTKAKKAATATQAQTTQHYQANGMQVYHQQNQTAFPQANMAYNQGAVNYQTQNFDNNPYNQQYNFAQGVQTSQPSQTQPMATPGSYNPNSVTPGSYDPNSTMSNSMAPNMSVGMATQHANTYDQSGNYHNFNQQVASYNSNPTQGYHSGTEPTTDIYPNVPQYNQEQSKQQYNTTKVPTKAGSSAKSSSKPTAKGSQAGPSAASQKEKAEDEDPSLFHKITIRKLFTSSFTSKSVPGQSDSQKATIKCADNTGYAALSGLSRILVVDILAEATKVRNSRGETEGDMTVAHLQEAFRRLRRKNDVFPYNNANFTLSGL